MDNRPPPAHRVDYDIVAPLYDEPWRDHPVDPHLVAFLEAAGDRLASPIRILDIGCGTGKQLAANRSRFPGIAMVGVDRFRGMLRIARERCPDVSWLHADGATLPLASDAFHYVTSQFAYPHIRRTGQLVAEAIRVLRSGGHFVMTNIDPWSMPAWLVYQYFPEAQDLDRRDFVPADEFADRMRAAGFANVHVIRDDRPKPESLREFLAFASRRHRASQLMAISDAAYAEGIRRLEEAVAAAAGHDALVLSAFVLVTIAGHKP